MLIAATTTHATRLAFQQASGTDRELTQQYCIGMDTLRKWRHRTTVHEASHTAHRLQTTLNAAQEELVIYLRTQLLPRLGHSRFPRPPKPDGECKPFKAYEPGYVHVKYLPLMQDEDKRRNVFVVIDRQPAGYSLLSSNTSGSIRQSPLNRTGFGGG